MKELKQYFEANKSRFLDELLEILRIPSVSADPKYAGDVRRMAEATAQHLRAVGVDTVEIHDTCPSSRAASCPVAASQMRTVLSW